MSYQFLPSLSLSILNYFSITFCDRAQSERCSPLSWVGPKRHSAPGISLEDMPIIDVILVSHNHYDHLDLPTLNRLAEKGATRSLVTLGNIDLVKNAGIPVVDELDWWESVRISPDKVDPFVKTVFSKS